MLLNELMSGPISIEGIAMDAMEHLDKWLGQVDPNRLAAEIPTKLPVFLKQHPRYANEADRAFMSENIGKISQMIMRYIQKQGNNQAQ